MFVFVSLALMHEKMAHTVHACPSSADWQSIDDNCVATCTCTVMIRFSTQGTNLPLVAQERVLIGEGMLILTSGPQN